MVARTAQRQRLLILFVAERQRKGPGNGRRHIVPQRPGPRIRRIFDKQHHVTGVRLQIGAVHIGLKLKSAGRDAHRLSKFGFELLRHANQRAIADGDKSFAAPQRFAVPVDKARGAGDNVRDRRRQPLQLVKIALLLGLAGCSLDTGYHQRHQQQIQHRRAKSAGDKPHALNAGIDIQNAIAGQGYRALRVGGQGKNRQAQCLDLTHRLQRRGAFSALRNRHHQIGMRIDSLVMRKVVRLFNFNQHAEALFKEIARAQSGV